MNGKLKLWNGDEIEIRDEHTFVHDKKTNVITHTVLTDKGRDEMRDETVTTYSPLAWVSYSDTQMHIPSSPGFANEVL